MGFNKVIQERVQRYKAFYADKSPGQIMVIISPYTFRIDYSAAGLQTKPLDAWNIEADAEAIIDRQIQSVKFFNEYTKNLDNDYIPTVGASLGTGVNSSYFSDADVIFGKETSWSHPVINQWEDLGKLKFDENNKWVGILKRMAKRSVDMCDGDYVPVTFSHFGPSDMANALRGNRLFYDFYDYPDKVHELLDISANATIMLERELREIVPYIMGGSVAAHAWMPGKALYLSEDAADLCSPAIYRNFFRQYTQKVIDAIGGAHIHHHGKGMHVHGEIAKLNGVRFIEISWDPNCPRPIDHLEMLLEQNEGMPLMTRCTVADVYEKIDIIRKGRVMLMLIVESLEEAKEAVAFIRRHSRI